MVVSNVLTIHNLCPEESNPPIKLKINWKNKDKKYDVYIRVRYSASIGVGEGFVAYFLDYWKKQYSDFKKLSCSDSCKVITKFDRSKINKKYFSEGFVKEVELKVANKKNNMSLKWAKMCVESNWKRGMCAIVASGYEFKIQDPKTKKEVYRFMFHPKS